MALLMMLLHATLFSDFCCRIELLLVYPHFALVVAALSSSGSVDIEEMAWADTKVKMAKASVSCPFSSHTLFTWKSFLLNISKTLSLIPLEIGTVSAHLSQQSYRLGDGLSISSLLHPHEDTNLITCESENIIIFRRHAVMSSFTMQTLNA